MMSRAHHTIGTVTVTVIHCDSALNELRDYDAEKKFLFTGSIFAVNLEDVADLTAIVTAHDVVL